MDSTTVAAVAAAAADVTLGARWIIVGSLAARCGDLIIATDPEDPTHFYVDDDRPPGARVMESRPLPLEGYSLDGVQEVLINLHDALTQTYGDREIPAAGLDVWYDLADERAKIAWEPVLVAQAQDAADEVAAREAELADVVDLSTVTPESVTYVWSAPRLPRRKITLLQGDPGVGKSWVSLAIAAEISREGKRVLLMQVEDDLADTTVPRLIGLGADRTKIRAFRLDKAPVLTPEGLGKMAFHIEAWNPDLVVIDPVTYFLGGKVDMHRANEVREVLAAVARQAERHDCAILAIIHMNKSNAKALYRSLGSIDFQAVVRSTLLAGGVEDEPGRGQALFHIKSNTGKKAEPLGYNLDDDGFRWTTTDLTQAEVEGRVPGPKPTKSREARAFLADSLRDGPRDGAEVKGLADDAGISARTLRDVSEFLVLKERVPDSNAVTWRLRPLPQ